MAPAREEAELPEDIIEEILLRLPIKSLIRFKRVSKHWLKLITSPRFGFRQYSIAQAQTFDNPRRASFFLLRMPDTDTSFAKSFITPITVFVRHEALRVKINPNIDFPHINWDKWYPYLPVLFSAGFGVYCVFEFLKGTALLWNPTARETKVLPPSPYYRPGTYVYHFGKMDYKDGNFSYKIGLVFSNKVYLSREGQEGLYKVTRLSLELFSNKTKSWKLIPDFCTGEFMGYTYRFFHSANLNGVAHWVIRSAEEGDIYITTFDYETEVLSRIKAPLSPEVGNYDKCRCIITIYDDKFLCLVLFWETNFLDIWVMREYGVEDSWTKEFTVRNIPMDMEVLGFSSKVRGIFLRPRSGVPTELLLYDCNSSTIKKYHLNTVYRHKHRLYMQVVEHVNSLISIE